MAGTEATAPRDTAPGPSGSVVICTTCRLPGADPDAPRAGELLSRALTRAGVAHRRQECLAACDRGCVIALCGAGRWSYLHGGLDPVRDLDDLITMIRAYAESPNGIVPLRARPAVIRKNTIARIPPLEV